MTSLRFDLECALRLALPSLKKSLDLAELACGLDDEAMIQALVESLDPHVTGFVERAPSPLPRHEECQECDALILMHQGRDSWDDPGEDEGSWHTHCTVCLEEWPCPDAGEVDEEAIESLQGRHRILAAIPQGKRTPSQHQALRKLNRDLDAADLLPGEEP